MNLAAILLVILPLIACKLISIDPRAGIEPAPQPWQGRLLPLQQRELKNISYGDLTLSLLP